MQLMIIQRFSIKAWFKCICLRIKIRIKDKRREQIAEYENGLCKNGLISYGYPNITPSEDL